MDKEACSDKSFNSKEEENSLDERQEDRYFAPQKKNIFDHSFIKGNFCPVKLSRSDIKYLSSDFEDQTLGGHREYREELIDGRLAKVYVYKIKIIKYENEILEIKQNPDGERYNPLIIVENNLIVPFNTSLVIDKQLSTTRSPVISPYEVGDTPVAKRGRPRKYPKGEEPYKLRKKMGDRYVDEIPRSYNYQNSNLFSNRPIDSKSMFDFGNNYEPVGHEYSYSPNKKQSDRDYDKFDFNSPFLGNRSSSPSSNQELSNKNTVASKAKNTNIDDFLSEYINHDSYDRNEKDHSDKYNNQYSSEYF